MKEILKDASFRKHIKRVVFPNIDLNAAWVDENPSFISNNENLKPILEMNMDIILIGEGFLIENRDDEFYYYDDEFQDKLMENPYDWIKVSAIDKKYSCEALQFFVNYYLNKDVFTTDSLVFIPFKRNGISCYLTTKETDVDILNKMKDILEEDIHGEDKINNKIESETNSKPLFMITSYEQYEDLMKSIETKEMHIFDDELKKINSLTKNNFENHPKEYYKFLDENKLEDY